MKALDLVSEVLIGKHISKENKEKAVKQRLNKAHIDVSAVHVRFTDNWDSCKGYKELQKEVQEGYWVYTHHVEAEFYDFSQHNTIEEALQHMRVIKSNPYSEGTTLYFLYKNELYTVEIKGLKI